MISKFLDKPFFHLCRKQKTFMLLSRPLHCSLLSGNIKLFETKRVTPVRLPCLGYATLGSKFNELTQLPINVWPNVFKTIKCYFLEKFVINYYYDPEFDLKAFSKSSQKVVEVVSGMIAEGDYKSLEGLVTPDVIEDVRVGVRGLNLRQFTQLSIRQEDIMYTFPYNIEIIKSEDKESLIVEITMVYHVVYGLPAFHARFIDDPPTSKELSASVSVVNYRFRRDFKLGIEPDWIINGLNHVQPKPQ